MDPSIAIVIGGALAFGGPLLLAWYNNRNRERERAEDIARQDAVALAVRDVAGKAKISAAASRAEAAETGSQLKQIHTLVNSNMTAALQGELDQTRISLVLMREVVGLKETAGGKASPENIMAITETEGRIAKLAAVLDDRMTQAKIVAAEIAANAEKTT